MNEPNSSTGNSLPQSNTIPEVSSNQTPLMGNTNVEPVAVKQKEFLTDANTSNKDALYQDLFRKNDDGELVTGKKPKKSGLEIFTYFMTFVTAIIVALTFAAGIHVFIKGQENNTLAENLPFLCKWFHYDINSEEDKGCKTAAMLEAEYREKQKQLESSIVNQLAVYIPLKISSSILSTSKERTFILDTYAKKVNIRTIIEQFETIRKNAISSTISNIECGNISITNMTTFASQCTVYGNHIGELGDARGNTLGSSRIEATLFLEKLADTNASKFILQNPSTMLSTEAIKDSGDIAQPFKTKTVIPLSLRYIQAPSQF